MFIAYAEQLDDTQHVKSIEILKLGRIEECSKAIWDEVKGLEMRPVCDSQTRLEEAASFRYETVDGDFVTVNTHVLVFDKGLITRYKIRKV